MNLYISGKSVSPMDCPHGGWCATCMWLRTWLNTRDINEGDDDMCGYPVNEDTISQYPGFVKEVEK